MAHHFHDHADGHGHAHTGDASRLVAAFGVIVVFMVIEIVGGLISGSLALLADAAHMFADSAALGLAASAHIIARRPPDSKRHFGYQRMQVLAAFFNGATLIVLSLWIMVEAVGRFFNPRDVEAPLMLGIAAAGFLANAVAFLMLQSSKTRNVNVKGALLHVAADLMSSVAAIIAAGLIMLTGQMRFDPLLSVVVALLISYSAVRLLIETGHILLEGAPRGIDVAQLKAGVKESAPGIEDVHDVRIWQITPEAASLTLHARIAGTTDAVKALDRIKSYLETEYGIRQSTVQIEIGDDCPDCSTLNGHAHDHEPAALHDAAEAHDHRRHPRGHPPAAALANQK
ncbi:MAG: cation diffusion facilitator family transporter [Parvularculaceae bacterium]